MGDRVQNFANEFRIRRLEANATTHVDAQNYREALAVLAELKKLQSNENVGSRVHTMAMEGLCHLRLSEDSAAGEVNQKIAKIMTSSNAVPNDITKMAEAFVKEDKHTRAYILYFVACKIFLVKEAKYAAKKISKAMRDMMNMAKKMVKLTADKIVVARHMIPAMKKIVEELVAMPDSRSNKKIENEAWCYYNIAGCYYHLGDTEQELAMYKAGFNIMKEKLGDDAKYYEVAGRCHDNAGTAYEALGQSDKAISAYKSAIFIFVEAFYMDHDTKKKYEERSRKNLARLLDLAEN